MRASVATTCGVVLGALAAACQPADVSGQGEAVQEHSFRQGGLLRSYLLHVPAALPRGPRPLVLVLHGGGGTHRGMIRLTRGRWNSLADRHGFIVAYPNADRRIWDFGEGVISRNRWRRVDDLAFFRRVVADIGRSLSVDRSRIFAAGMSRGGQAAWFLACKWPGAFRAILAVTMPLPGFLEDDCRRGPATGIAVMNGTKDPLVPYHGGQIRVFGRDRGAVLSTDATIRLWRRRNGCRETADRTAVLDRPGDGTRTLKSEWTTCTGAPITLYRIEGGGHTWPNGRPYLRRALIGPVSRDFDGAEAGWAFFSRF